MQWKWNRDVEMDNLLLFLRDEGIITAREDLAPDLLMLTEKGRVVLAAHHIEHAEEAQRNGEKKDREAKRLQERHEDYANAERRYRTQNKIAIIMPALTFVLGLFVEHFCFIAGTIIGWFH